jgi:tetrahydromethanopterin S-methyltransferase subunit G
VDYIPDISRQILDSMEFKETLKDIDKLTNKCYLITNGLKQRVNTSKTSLKDATAEIVMYRKEINKRLDELEKEVKDTATTIQRDNNKKLKTTETTCDDINKSLQASADTLKHLNANKKTDQLFTELKITKQLIQDDNNIISQLPTVNDIDEYIFEPNQDIKKFFQDEKSLGTLNSKKGKPTTEPKNQGAVSMKMSTPRCIYAKTSSDQMDCSITGIAVFQNEIFAADSLNQSIKRIDINNGAIKQIQLASSPWDITVVSSGSLAVTLPENETIQFISFSTDSHLLKYKLKVDGDCYGISYHHRKLAVTFTYLAKLQIKDLKGNTEITVDKDSNGDNIFIYPGYVTTNSDSIYVSDNHRHVVLRLNWLGEMIGLVGIQIPMGMTLFDDGSLVVNDGKCIHRVSDDFKDSKTILENVDSPYAACWCAEASTLYVSRINNSSYLLYKIM